MTCWGRSAQFGAVGRSGDQPWPATRCGAVAALRSWPTPAPSPRERPVQRRTAARRSRPRGRRSGAGHWGGRVHRLLGDPGALRPGGPRGGAGGAGGRHGQPGWARCRCGLRGPAGRATRWPRPPTAAGWSSMSPPCTGSGPRTPTTSTTSTSTAPGGCWKRPARPAVSDWSTRPRWGPSGCTAPPPTTRWTRPRSPRSTICSADTSGPSTWPSTRCCGPAPRDWGWSSSSRPPRSVPRDRGPTPTGRTVLEILNGRFPGYVDTTLNIVDVDDVAHGQILAAERGRNGRSYILGGENMKLRDVLSTLARISGASGGHPPVSRELGPGRRPPLRPHRGADARTRADHPPRGGQDVDDPHVVRRPSGQGRARLHLSSGGRGPDPGGPVVRGCRLGAARTGGQLPLGHTTLTRPVPRVLPCDW